MTFDAQRLYDLLPAIYRIRDQAEGQPLRALLAVMAEQIGTIEENLEQLYDDQFIETCADWAVPYIGDLIGYRALHGVAPKISSPRAEVGNTIAYRRRKGTAAMLEQLARDVTGWPARVVEFFELLATTQYMNHIRLQRTVTADLRDWEPLERAGTAFDSLAHTIDVRRISTRKGRYNISNIGIFLWRVQSFRLSDSPAVAVDARRFLFSPLGNDISLFTRPETEDQIAHIATPLDVPDLISRRVFAADRDAYFGADDKSIAIEANGSSIPLNLIHVCNLADAGGANWAHQPNNFIGVDPVLGRIAFPSNPSPPSNVKVTFHYGFPAEIGGGPYGRADAFAELEAGQQRHSVRMDAPSGTPNVHATIQDALDAVKLTGGIVEISDNGRYEEKLSIDVALGKPIELRAAEERRPTLVLGADFEITGSPDASVTLNGLLIVASDSALASSPGILKLTNASPGAPGQLQLRLRHCTLVPGLFLDVKGEPQRPDVPSLVVATENVAVEIDKSIIGGVRLPPGSDLVASDSILDSTSAQRVAYSDIDGIAAGGTLTLRECTVIGKIHAEILKLVSNSILHAELAATDAIGTIPIRATRKQEGCVRFSYLPLSAIVPRRFRCQPEFAIATEIERIEKQSGKELDATQNAAVRARIEAWLVPAFMALRYGRPDYALLRESCPYEIRTGADDGSEMGVFHSLYQPQRETNLRVRLEEYLRFGLEAGIFFA